MGHVCVNCVVPSESTNRRFVTGDRRMVAGLFAALIVGNVAAWVWAIAAFRHFPLLLGTCLLAYGLGLRHAIDADHIAAIDNVTRAMLQSGRRALTNRRV